MPPQLDQHIATGVHYRMAAPSTRAFGARVDESPVAEDRANRQLSLPIHPYMTAEDARRVAAALHAAG